ncbi:MAG: phytanoyl-CoA dioxygenase family protein [Bdellovibrionota bacterium]
MFAKVEPSLDFDASTLPWIDSASDAEIERYASEHTSAPGANLSALLKKWRDEGYVIFENVARHDLIDAYLHDVNAVLTAHDLPIAVLHEKRGNTTLDRLDDEDLRERHMRLVDFHFSSEAGRDLAMSEVVTWFLGHVFRSRLVLKQSLTFMHGPEQWLHQDFAYVRTSIPSHLCGVWYALEDVVPAAGPLRFFPGSHVVEKFDFGNGLIFDEHSTRNDREFGDYLEEKMKARDWPERHFHAKKGDVLLWHSGLVHGSGVTRDPSLTRKSFVAHYSTPSSEGINEQRNSVHIRGYENSKLKDLFPRG